MEVGDVASWNRSSKADAEAEGYLAIPPDSDVQEAVELLDSQHVFYTTTPVSGRSDVSFVTSAGAEYPGIDGIRLYLGSKARRPA